MSPNARTSDPKRTTWRDATLARCDPSEDRLTGPRGRACRRLRKCCKFHTEPDAFADTKCRAGVDHVDVADPLAVALPYSHGGTAARPGPGASEDFACRNGPGRLVLSAQQFRNVL
jgi:hypothetical protein